MSEDPAGLLAIGTWFFPDLLLTHISRISGFIGPVDPVKNKAQKKKKISGSVSLGVRTAELLASIVSLKIDYGALKLK
jgi:hypothetical protein